METQRMTLWCKIRGKLVEVVLVKNSGSIPRAGLPHGWEVENCLGKDTPCFKAGCLFTIEEDVQKDMAWPFSEGGKPN